MVLFYLFLHYLCFYTYIPGEPLEKDSPQEDVTSHFTPVREKVDPTVGTEPGPVDPSNTHLDYGKFVRQFFEWFGGVPFAGGKLGNIQESLGW